jgi:hypothetical protein
VLINYTKLHKNSYSTQFTKEMSENQSRRSFLQNLGVGLGTTAAAFTVPSIMMRKNLELHSLVWVVMPKIN